MNGYAETMNRETKRRVEIAVALAAVALLYLLNWLTGNL